MKETPFRPPQPCPPPARTPPLPPGLSAAPVPSAPPSAHSNLLRRGRAGRRHSGLRDRLCLSVGGVRESRSRRAAGQAATEAAPAPRGRGTAEAARRRPRARGMGRRPRANASPEGRSVGRAQGVTYILQRPLGSSAGSPPMQPREWGPWEGVAGRDPGHPELVHHALLKDLPSFQARGRASGAQGLHLEHSRSFCLFRPSPRTGAGRCARGAPSVWTNGNSSQAAPPLAPR